MEVYLKEWFGVDETTPIERFLNGPKKKKHKVFHKEKMRNVMFDPTHYNLLRAGDLIIKSEAEIPSLNDEKHFYIFVHKDTNMHRNQDVPAFEAAYLTKEGRYLRVQKCHLRQAYSKCKRTDLTKMYDMMPDGTPYWVDRFIFSKESQRQSKRKYENKKKQ
jgi:hypothetical protein